MIELRVRNRAHPETLERQVGKQLTSRDYDVMLTGAARILKPNGQPLAVYLPGILRGTFEASPDVYEILHGLRTVITDNRGAASGSRLLRPEGQGRSRARRVASAIVGASDPMSLYRHCRLTEWTGRHLPEYARLAVLLEAVAQAFQANVPDRYAVQQGYVARTSPDWVVPGTPFTTITVNNTYATGVHKDAGDLAAGFSCLAVYRKGHFDGGHLVFPEYRVAANLQHGDLILMDAHDWHGNTPITCPHGRVERAVTHCPTCQGERISIVCYYRERMADCGSAVEERQKAQANADRRSSLTAEGGG